MTEGKKNIAYKYRIYPDAEQQVLFAKVFGCTRFVYNALLTEKKKHYEATGKSLRNTPAHLAKATNDNGFGQFRAFLAYKTERKKKKLITIDKWFASSKICLVCGEKKADLTLSDREWTCPCCGAHHDRDVNAAVNIRNEGLRMLAM